jgi:hypothetical protein
VSLQEHGEDDCVKVNAAARGCLWHVHAHVSGSDHWGASNSHDRGFDEHSRGKHGSTRCRTSDNACADASVAFVVNVHGQGRTTMRHF